ncbi:MAG: single-stranded DNA-binding protein [Patescibacteria group bacterium]|nr:single-stranded DNA-binding protein [Patescibacteria group bacterium]
MNLNKVFLIGRLTADPQLRATPSGAQVATFSVATNRTWTDPSGAKKEQVEFHNVVVWGRQAEVASRFLTKGSSVLIEGRLQTREWEGKDGQKRKTTEIVSERLQLGPKPMGGKAPAQNASAASEIPTIDVSDEAGPSDDIKPEDLPF